jgi:glycosyltransferase involved in cell wall biosynthesis
MRDPIAFVLKSRPRISALFIAGEIERLERTGADARHLGAIAPEATMHTVYHGLNADFSRLVGHQGAAAPAPSAAPAANGMPCPIMDSGGRDGIPNVLAAAMAAGTPVVATPVSGIPEIGLLREAIG